MDSLKLALTVISMVFLTNCDSFQAGESSSNVQAKSCADQVSDNSNNCPNQESWKSRFPSLWNAAYADDTTAPSDVTYDQFLNDVANKLSNRSLWEPIYKGSLESTTNSISNLQSGLLTVEPRLFDLEKCSYRLKAYHGTNNNPGLNSQRVINFKSVSFSYNPFANNSLVLSMRHSEEKFTVLNASNPQESRTLRKDTTEYTFALNFPETTSVEELDNSSSIELNTLEVRNLSQTFDNDFNQISSSPVVYTFPDDAVVSIEASCR
tara:strand:+ start:1175 stop:1969 length:795 start_codon:yes stop_codon:yes gene_type:complete